MEQTKLGIVGCGNISDAYLKGGANSNIVAVKSVTDLNKEAADAKAELAAADMAWCRSCGGISHRGA